MISAVFNFFNQPARRADKMEKLPARIEIYPPAE